MHLESSVGNSQADVQQSQRDALVRKRSHELKMKLDVQFKVMEKMDFLKEKPEGVTDEEFNKELMAAFDHWDKVGNGKRFRESYQELLDQGVTDADVLVEKIFQRINDEIARESNAAVLNVHH